MQANSLPDGSCKDLLEQKVKSMSPEERKWVWLQTIHAVVYITCMHKLAVIMLWVLLFPYQKEFYYFHIKIFWLIFMVCYSVSCFLCANLICHHSSILVTCISTDMKPQQLSQLKCAHKKWCRLLRNLLEFHVQNHTLTCAPMALPCVQCWSYTCGILHCSTALLRLHACTWASYTLSYNI